MMMTTTALHEEAEECSTAAYRTGQILTGKNIVDDCDGRNGKLVLPPRLQRLCENREICHSGETHGRVVATTRQSVWVLLDWSLIYFVLMNTVIHLPYSTLLVMDGLSLRSKIWEGRG